MSARQEGAMPGNAQDNTVRNAQDNTVSIAPVNRISRKVELDH